jgi:hypothetical protein
MKLIIDPEFRDLIPPLAPAELDQLHASLCADGCQSPLIVWREKQTLVDGHNRYAYLTKFDMPFETIQMSFDNREQVKRFIILNQLGRRNLDPDTASRLRGMLYNGAKKEAGSNLPQNRLKDQNDTLANQDTAEAIAKQTGVSAPTIKRDAKFADALEKLEMTIGEFKASGKSRKDVIAEAFPPKAPKPAPQPQATALLMPEPEPTPEPTPWPDDEDEQPLPPKPAPIENTPWTTILLNIPKITKEQRQELFEMLARKWDCKHVQS